MAGGESEGKWTETTTVHSYEVDAARKLTLESLFRLFQEVAWNHAEHLGVGFSHLRRRNQAWALSRMDVRIDTYPAWGQHVTIRTWPRGVKSPLALRDFELLDEDGRKLALASSSWIVVDLESRRPLRPDSIVAHIRSLSADRAIGVEAERITVPESMPVMTALEVRYSDLDLNDHVNNAAYVRWILDGYPVSFHRTHRVARIALNFVAEVTEGETVQVCCVEAEPLRMLHRLKRRSDGVEACRALLCWEPVDLP